MNYEILSSGNLRIFVDPDEQRDLRELHDEDSEYFVSDDRMYEIFEDLICNSVLDWVQPEDIGALTSAPILGIRGPERELKEGENPNYLDVVGNWDGKTWVQDVETAWGYMNYMITSPQEDLAKYGEVIFQSGD